MMLRRRASLRDAFCRMRRSSLSSRSAQTGEDVLGRCRECQIRACDGMNDGGIPALFARYGDECENVCRSGQFLHEHFSFRGVHIGSPSYGGCRPSCLPPAQRTGTINEKQSPVPF